MRNAIYRFALASLLLLPAVARSQAPGFGGSPEKFEPVLKVDWSTFRSSEEGKTRLEVYYQVYNFGLQYAVDGKEYVANFDISAEIFDGDNQIETYERSRQIRVASQAQTRSRYDFRTSQFSVSLKPGKYTVRVLLTDRGNNAQIRREIKPSLPDYGGKYAGLSGIEFIRTATPAAGDVDSNNVFLKGDQVAIPSVGRDYGGQEDSVLRLYYEVYPGSSEEKNVVVQATIRQRSRGVVFRDTAQISLDHPVASRMLTANVRDFAPGDYELEVTLHGRRMKELERRAETFSIVWTEEALLRLDWKSAVSQLGYIASPGELGKLKKAKTIEERQVAFSEYWNQRDPTIGTPENETKRQFYHRINVADRQFSSMRREGWKTDRGRIYIIHGEPDQIDDEPYSPDVVPYQIWHYYSEGRYRRFVFIDKNDDGDYRLQFPYDGLNQRPDF